MPIVIEQNKQKDYERYQAFEAFEAQRRLTDEITDMSERLAAPMRNIFEYEVGDDGELWFQGEPLGKTFDKGIEVAEELTMANPQFTTELIRRRLERQEYDDMRKLAFGSDDDPDLLVVLSPIPDAVLNGLQLNAYDTERKKTLARIFRRTEAGIEATSLSLDLSDRDGLKAIVQCFGKTIDPNASSEDILAMRLWGYEDELESHPSKAIRSLYDGELSRKFGGEWYAGRQSSRITDAKAFIELQVDLVNQHMEEISMLKKKYSEKDLGTKLETARYNLAAALSRRLRGDTDSASLSEAGDTARANGERYAGDCPTGVSVTGEQSLTQLGIGREWKYGSCRVCLQNSMVGECHVCVGCENADNRGKDLNEIHKAALRRRSQQRPETTQPAMRLERKQQKRTNAKTIFGSHVEERTQFSVGGADILIVDRRTGEAIAKKTQGGYASL